MMVILKFHFYRVNGKEVLVEPKRKSVSEITSPIKMRLFGYSRTVPKLERIPEGSGCEPLIKMYVHEPKVASRETKNRQNEIRQTWYPETINT